MGAVLGLAALAAMGCIIVWLVQGVRRRWKRPEPERMDDQGVLRGWLLLPLVSLLGLTRGQGANQAAEDGQESETRPLLSG